MRPFRLIPRAATLALGLAVAACAVPVAGGLDEGDANRVVTALDRAAIEGQKEPDPAIEGRFRVRVAAEDAQRAVLTLEGEGLPRPRSPGVLDAVDKGALVPSAAQEHAQLVAGMAGDLERSLEGIDGVLAARVHLNVPLADPLAGRAPLKTTASVLLEHRGPTPPLTESAIARLVAGGVPGLAPSDVAVVMLGRPVPPRAAGTEVTHVGPIAVLRASRRLLQAALGGLVCLVAMLAAGTAWLFSRARRLAAERLKAEARLRA